MNGWTKEGRECYQEHFIEVVKDGKCVMGDHLRNKLSLQQSSPNFEQNVYSLTMKKSNMNMSMSMSMKGPR